MRYYYEALENVKDEVTTPDFIRIDITDMTEPERDAVITSIKSIMSGKDYRLDYHECGHNENKGCKTEVL